MSMVSGEIREKVASLLDEAVTLLETESASIEERMAKLASEDSTPGYVINVARLKEQAGI